MERDHVGEGFPNIERFYVDSLVALPRPGEAMLLFYKPSDDAMFIHEVRVILTGSGLLEANLEMKKFYSPNIISFPEMTFCDVRDETRSGAIKKILTIGFVNGTLSYQFEKAFYLKTVRPLGPRYTPAASGTRRGKPQAND